MSPERLRELSHQLFGNGFVIELGAAIARFSDPKFTLTMAARAAGLERNIAATALRKMEKGHVIKRLPKEGRDQPYERQPTVYWRFLEEMHRELKER